MTDGERAQNYIRERAGTAYCGACLGRDLRLTPVDIQSVMWELQQSPAFLLRTGQCSSCLRTRRVLSEAPETPVIGSEATVIAFLCSRAGEALCDACLAFGTQLSLEEARRCVADLAALPEFSHAEGQCSVCGRSKPLVAAAGVLREVFPNRAEADAFALQRAKEWIEKRGD